MFDWDEINFAESSREMLVSSNFSQVMINFEPFHEKPPLFFWLQVLSMKIFGIGSSENEIRKGRSVVFFPEGGWDNSEKGMRRFKNGQNLNMNS